MKGEKYQSNRNTGPWPENFVKYEGQILQLPDKFKDVVNNATSERPIQKWLENHPVALLPMLPNSGSNWVFAQPKFGAEYIPDFLVTNHDSSGYHWYLIELENPRYPILTGSGQQSHLLTHAIAQIMDWRIWLRQNVQYVQHQLGFTDLDAEFEGLVVMGRRSKLPDQYIKRFRELSRAGLTVMTYDRLIEYVSTLLWNELPKG